MEIFGSLEMQLFPSISISCRIPCLHPEVLIHVVLPVYQLFKICRLPYSAYVFLYTMNQVAWKK